MPTSQESSSHSRSLAIDEVRNGPVQVPESGPVSPAALHCSGAAVSSRIQGPPGCSELNAIKFVTLSWNSETLRAARSSRSPTLRRGFLSSRDASRPCGSREYEENEMFADRVASCDRGRFERDAHGFCGIPRDREA